MKINSIIESIESVAEEVKKTKSGLVHKAGPGGYGRKDDEDESGKKKEPEKRGRGRPSTTGAHTQSPEEKKKQKDKEEAGKKLQSTIVGNLPDGKSPGKKGKVHKIKEEIQVQGVAEEQESTYDKQMAYELKSIKRPDIKTLVAARIDKDPTALVTVKEFEKQMGNFYDKYQRSPMMLRATNDIRNKMSTPGYDANTTAEYDHGLHYHLETLLDPRAAGLKDHSNLGYDEIRAQMQSPAGQFKSERFKAYNNPTPSQASWSALTAKSKNSDMNQGVAEGTKETPTGKIHKAEPGGYGRKDDEDEKGKKAKSAEPEKRGRGRPSTTGAHTQSPEEKKKQQDKEEAGKRLQSFMVGNLPKDKKGKTALPGKTSKKNKLKEWMDQVEVKTILESIDSEGSLSDVDYILQQIASGEMDLSELRHKDESMLTSAETHAKNVLDKKAFDIAGMNRLSMRHDPEEIDALVIDSLKQEYGNLDEEEEEVTITPAQQNTQVIKQGDKTLGTVTNPQVANTLKQAMTKGDIQLGGTVMGESKQAVMENTLVYIIKNHPHEHKMAQDGWGLPENLYQALCDHYHDNGSVPRDIWHGDQQGLRDWVEECYMKEAQEIMENPDQGMSLRDRMQAKINTPPGMRSDKTPLSLSDVGAAPKFSVNGQKFDISNQTVARGTAAVTGQNLETLPESDLEQNIRGAVEEMENSMFENKKQKAKDSQMESWEAQLNKLLTEGLTVTTSTGQQGVGDSVSVSATDEHAQTLMKLLQDAGLTGGVSGSVVGDSAVVEPVSSDEVMSQLSSEESDDSGDADLSFLKKMLSLRGGEEPEAMGGEEPEAMGGEEPEAEPAEEPEQYASDEEDEEPEEKVDEAEVEEGNAFSGAVAKAKADGIQPGEKINVGGKEYPVKEEEQVEEGYQTCNECGEMMEAEHSCSSKEAVYEKDEENLNEWANTPNGKTDDKGFKAELAMMTHWLSGGPNKIKHDQTVMPSTKVKADLENISMAEMIRKLEKLQ